MDKCLEQTAESFMLGVLMSRYILQGMGHSQQVVDDINRQSLRTYLQKLINGDLVIQDQLISGYEFDPESESEFQKTASQLLKILEEL